tara:strand:+ start:766 stop:1755 length:990 start_codon:yes stop_codon:yes gene_type:complete
LEFLNQGIQSQGYVSYLIIFLTFFASRLICVHLVPKIINIGENLELYDYPGIRKIHSKPLLRSGGIALFISYISPLIILLLISNNNNQLFITFLLGNFLFFLIGLLDDFYNLSPYIKLFLQFLMTSLLFYFGIKITGIDFSNIIFFDRVIFPRVMSSIFTSLWIVGIINSINWIDGLDGLASGISLIFSLGVFLINLINGQLELAIICASLTGANLGFLKYNFNPAKILMGDSGSYFLGFALSILSLDILTFDKSNFFTFSSILLLIIPICDMFFVIINRLLRGANPFYPDSSHLHHRLLKKIGNQKQTVLLIYLISFIFTSLAIFFSY